ncbi:MULTISPECIES: MarR family winged helix-turn-helix transcriptional regulator [unclassified Frondihabitans]|uniref:MarR family winged helix-turn-helix transcriptional regulator n=1 Tax=unclassified Frondihabitans TaxID=2626248 RepID=UPI000F516271|nr:MULTISPECIES: MarR family transcriptional regulator [unclassified Frondihabitans]RPE77639.1 DNA-binding MarR family transcriptional regulator [Frondihabitans sp. PhB153]RPF07916.1 DNA-binding MarR family transcriptional regulator [Frondihabitans sp. PhB161]
MNTTSARTPVDVNEADLLALLGAYQHLQAQNLRMSTHLSADLGLSPTDLRVLLYLFRTENVSPRDLATLLEHTTGSITAMVDRLEKMEHVERRPHPTDRRSQTLHLTDTGISAVQHVRDAYQNAFDGVFTGPALRTASKTLRALGDALTPLRSDK